MAISGCPGTMNYKDIPAHPNDNYDDRLENQLILKVKQAAPKNELSPLIMEWLIMCANLKNMNSIKPLRAKCLVLCHTISMHINEDLPPEAIANFDLGFNDCYTHNDLFDCMLKELITMSNYINIANVGGVSYCVNVAIRYIEDHCTEKIKLSDISRLTYVSPSNLSALFKQKTGRNFSDYLCECKIKKAADYIKNGMSVQQSANMVSYDDMKHFRQMFKKYMGINPSEHKNLTF